MHQDKKALLQLENVRNIKAKEVKKETIQSYLELLSHGNTRKLQKKIENTLVNNR